MHASDKNVLKILCYIVALPMGVLMFKGIMIALPYLGMLILAMIIGTILVYYFDL